MKRIQLTQGKVALIDDEDYARVMQFKWHASQIRGKWYASTTGEGDKTFYLHRLIMNAPSGVQVDHENNNGLDCRRQNLRIASALENQSNRGMQKNNTSGFKGVTYDDRRRKYQARIQTRGKKLHIGYYATAEQAARAYDKFALVLHGEFANTNFPKETYQ